MLVAGGALRHDGVEGEEARRQRRIRNPVHRVPRHRIPAATQGGSPAAAAGRQIGPSARRDSLFQARLACQRAHLPARASLRSGSGVGREEGEGREGEILASWRGAGCRGGCRRGGGGRPGRGGGRGRAWPPSAAAASTGSPPRCAASAASCAPCPPASLRPPPPRRPSPPTTTAIIARRGQPTRPPEPPPLIDAGRHAGA